MNPALLLAALFVPPPNLPPVPVLPQDKVLWSCDFEGTRCDLHEQSKVEPQARSYFAPGREGGTAIALLTEPGDDQVHGSGTWERDDLELPPSPDYCNEGQEEWWAMSVLFPDTYVPSVLGAVMDFHDNSGMGLANFHLTAKGTELWFDGFGADLLKPVEYHAHVAPILRNLWYDFTYHVKWSSGPDGFMVAWLNGYKMLSYQGPTLYKGISCYLKLANYHAPNGSPSAIVFDRVMRGTSAKAVELHSLEGE